MKSLIENLELLSLLFCLSLTNPYTSSNILFWYFWACLWLCSLNQEKNSKFEFTQSHAWRKSNTVCSVKCCLFQSWWHQLVELATAHASCYYMLLDYHFNLIGRRICFSGWVLSVVLCNSYLNGKLIPAFSLCSSCLPVVCLCLFLAQNEDLHSLDN